MIGLIWTLSLAGYLVIGLLCARRFVVMLLDDPAFGDRPYDRRREEVFEDGLWLIIGVFLLWPLAIVVYLIYLVFGKALWERETPGERKFRLAAEEKKKNDEHREAESSA